jgi:hypothetical protein
MGSLFQTIEFKNLYFQQSDKLSLDYDANESIKYNVMFHCDFMNITYNKYQEILRDVSTNTAGINGLTFKTPLT